MQKLKPFLIILTFISIIIAIFLSLASSKQMIVVLEGNSNKQPIKMELNRYQDSDCGMVITELKYASQVIAPDGKTWFFHDHGGFIKWLSNKSFKDKTTIWVMSRDTLKWIDARTAKYSLNENTPMGYGFGAYENLALKTVSFKEMTLKVLRGETLNNPKIRQQILGDR